MLIDRLDDCILEEELFPHKKEIMEWAETIGSDPEKMREWQQKTSQEILESIGRKPELKPSKIETPKEKPRRLKFAARGKVIVGGA